MCQGLYEFGKAAWGGGCSGIGGGGSGQWHWKSCVGSSKLEKQGKLEGRHEGYQWSCVWDSREFCMSGMK